MRTVRDWFFSIPTLVAFGLILGIGELVSRFTLLFGMGPYEQMMARLQRALIWAFSLSGVSVDVEGRENLASSGGYIFVSNHQSMFDIPIFGGILSNYLPRFVSKRSLANGLPTVSLYLRAGGHALIDRGDRAQALTAIADMGAWCEDRGVAAVIFPEGTRSRDGSLGSWKVAGLEALLGAAPDLQIVPTVIDGSWRVFANNMMPVPFGTDVKVRVGVPIDRSSDEDPEAILAVCRQFAQDTLDEWHTGSDRPN